ncbi:Protein of unknown function, partial [Gryllus bimaculatus]
PAAPLELRCARAEPRALALRWRLPLRAGGRLSEARMEVRGPAGSRRRFFSTRPERDALWEQRTEDGVLGRPATLFLWTTPDGRLAEGKCPSLTRTQHTHTPPPPSAREMASETAGDGNPERILEVEDVTASSWRASDGVGSENAGDEAGGGAGTADGGRRCGAAGGSGREGTAAGDSGCGGVGSGSSAEGWGDGMHGEGRDGGGGVGSTAVSLSKWSWLPGVCIFLLFLLALVIIAVSRAPSSGEIQRGVSGVLPVDCACPRMQRLRLRHIGVLAQPVGAQHAAQHLRVAGDGLFRSPAGKHSAFPGFSSQSSIRKLLYVYE